MKKIIQRTLVIVTLAWFAIASMESAHAVMNFDCGTQLQLTINNAGWSWGKALYKDKTYNLTPYSIGSYPIFTNHHGYVGMEANSSEQALFFLEKIATSSPTPNKSFKAYYSQHAVSNVSDTEENYTCVFLP